MNPVMMLQESKMIEAGRKDAHGSYGNYLSGLESQEGIVTDYALSPTMEELIRRYDADCERMERHAWVTKGKGDRLRRLAIDLIKRISKKDIELSFAEEKVDSAEREYKACEEELAAINQQRAEGKGVPKETFIEKETAENRRTDCKNAVDKQMETYNGLRMKREKFGEKCEARIRKLKIRFDRRLDKLDAKANRFKSKYKHLLMVYWKSFSDTLGRQYSKRVWDSTEKNSPEIKPPIFEDICQRMDVTIRDKDNILETDQAEIAKIVKELLDYINK